MAVSRVNPHKFCVGQRVRMPGYGECTVRKLLPVFRGEPRYVVEMHERVEVSPMEPPQMPGDTSNCGEAHLEGNFTVDPARRAALYNEAFPNRPPLAYGNDWVVGTWCIGAYYKNPNKLYGAYPHGYLERIATMFPEACQVLHAFSGGLDLLTSLKAFDVLGQVDPDHVLVDLKGPDEGRRPTWQGDVLAMPEEWTGRFDLILADPPYTKEDAAMYETSMINRSVVMRVLRRVARRGGNLVWLDQVWPMHRKNEWRTWGQVGLVRSTNHRVRLVSMFEAV